MRRYLPMVIALVLVAGTGFAQTAPVTPMKYLNSNGEAIVYVKPDNVRVHVGVLSISPELAAARQENATTFQRVLDAVKALKYDNMFMKSVAFDVSTLTENRNIQDLKPPQIVGYQVQNELSIRLTGDDAEKLSERAANLIDAAVGAGANRVGNIEIFVMDETKYKEEALIKAIENARSRAQKMAAVLGLEIVGYQNVNAQQDYYYASRMNNSLMQTAAAPSGGDGASTPVEAGLVQIRATASLTCIIEAKE